MKATNRFFCLLVLFALIPITEYAQGAAADPFEQEMLFLKKQMLYPSIKKGDKLVDCESLDTAFGELIDQFIKEQAANFTPEQRALYKREFATVQLRKQLRDDLTFFLQATAAQQRRWKDAGYDNRDATARAKKIITILRDFDVALPAHDAWIIKKIEGGKLHGAQLEAATHTLAVSLSLLLEKLKG